MPKPTPVRRLLRSRRSRRFSEPTQPTQPTRAARPAGAATRRGAALLAASALLTALLSAVLAGPASAAPASAVLTSTALTSTGLANAPHYSLPLALQESLYFYDAQKSGPARTDGDQPLSWRGDSEPSDSCVPLQPKSATVPNGVNMSAAFIAANSAVLDPNHTGCVNLSGGFHDAGDHVKFGLPQSYAASVLGWGMQEFPQAYQATGTWAHGLDEMKWFSDYFLRSTFLNPAGQVVAFAYQVGEGSVDHDYWGPSELQSPAQYPRPAYLATTQTPAADQTASAAAALAVESLLTASSNASYSAQCLRYAQALYAFARANPGTGYSGGFYNSSGYVSEEAWAADWLYLATGDFSYINDIISTNSSGTYNGYLANIITAPGSTWQNTWVMSWDSRWGGVFSVLDPIVAGNSSVPAATQSAIHYFNKWQVQYWSHVPHDSPGDTNFIPTTPAGFSYLTSWGSARYDTAAQLEALVYRKNFPTDPQSVLFSDWAMGQMNYLMGDNPADWSYIVGFGSTTPGVGSEVGGTATAASHPHQSDAQGSLDNSQTDPLSDRHILWGALVGGPSATDQPDDLTTDYVLNEVAVDYNAAFVGALAGLYQYYGQSQAMTAFTPSAEPAGTPYYATAALNQDTGQGTQLTVSINNEADQPPHFESDLSARVYFDISSIYAAGQTISDVSTPVYYDAADQIDGRPTSISAPTQWGGADSCLYYVTVDWPGDQIGLPPSRALEFGINSAIGPNYKYYWSSAASPGFTGLAAGSYASTPDPYIPVYAGGKLVYGQQPSTTADDSCAPGGSGGSGPATVTAEYETSAASATTSTISNQIELVNNGTSAIPLANLTIRYWFTEDGSGGLQNRIYQASYATMTQANDYSFNAADAGFTASQAITPNDPTAVTRLMVTLLEVPVTRTAAVPRPPWAEAPLIVMSVEFSIRNAPKRPPQRYRIR